MAGGWCTFEDPVSSELLVRLNAFPKMREALDKLPPKMLQLHSDQPAQPVDLSKDQVRSDILRPWPW